MMVPYIIAEAGSCHEGEYERARELIRIAACAGADAIKFQFWSSAKRMRERRRVEDETAYRVGSIDRTWIPFLRHAAGDDEGLDFLCTAYLPEDIPVVAPYVTAFKVSSFEATPEFVKLHGPYGKIVYVSLGMRGELTSEWYAALDALATTQARIQWLHCISAYPCPLSEANVKAVSHYQGYSDHTHNVLTGAVAVGAGAEVLEVHFRLDDTSSTCPDYCVSLSPEELKQYIDNTRLAYVLMGDGIKRVMPSEEENVKHKVRES